MARATFRVKKVVIVGCGAQGLNQGLNMRDSGLDISYALRKEAIAEKRASWRKATENGFKVGTYEELIRRRIWWLT
ncbi:ketol-acid reductoisomerase [Escherichia coli]|uniref:Ketol-acid reductoisomerase n=1 Tax=Escherichia coli TaxID=562 RepID=A0A376MLW7_ECOLX|nr:ketol-acid reductoisomerase [Escherichia coli]